MNEIIQQFLDEQPTKPYNTYRSLQGDCKLLNDYLELKNKQLLKLVNKSEVERYVNFLSQNYSSKTIKRRICTLRKLLYWCQDRGLIPEKKEISIVEYEPIPKQQFADNNEISLIYDYCSRIDEKDDYITARVKMECLLIVLCGFKTSELAELTLKDISENAIKYKDSAKRNRIRLFQTELLDKPLTMYLEKRTLFTVENDIVSNLLFITTFGSVSTRIHADFNTMKRLAGVSSSVTAAAVRNSCLKYYYDKITDDVLISKLFNVSDSWIRHFRSD